MMVLAPNVHEISIYDEVISTIGNDAMRRAYLWKWPPCVLGLACGLVADRARAEDPPALAAPSEVEVRDLLPRRGSSAPSQGDAVHEVIRAPAVARVSEHIEKSPPSPINERPGVHPPGPNHQWIEGYWEWDRSRKDFVWVTGTWYVPPPGSFWVNSHWRRDERGWTRVSGFWSGRQSQRVDWRKTGPPADRPEEAAGPAPGPDYFYVAGQYIPDGDGVAWRPGFWSRTHSGWEWAPARWIRQASGWAFQEGRWNRATNAGEPRNPQPGRGSTVRGTTIVSTPAEAGTPLPDASDPASTGALPLLISADPPPTTPARPPAEASAPLDAETRAIERTALPPRTFAAPPSFTVSPSPTAASPPGSYDPPYRDGSLEGGELNASASSPTRADRGLDTDLPAASRRTQVPFPEPLETGNPSFRSEGFPQFGPSSIPPPAGYAPGPYEPGGPYYYRRGYNGTRLRNGAPRARGLLNRILPR